MSNKQNNTNTLNCPCDEWKHPQELHISAGQSTLQRQIATFAEFRRAMLSEINNYFPLTHWNARSTDDLGVMLLEMWAYVCDALSFYDEVIAHEAYLRTANRPISIRRLVELLGYLPRPAIAARAELAALADGRQPLVLPQGTAFRSGPVGEDSPQLFELDQDTLIHPFTNQWEIKKTVPATIKENPSSYLLIRPEAEIVTNTLLLAQHTIQSKQNRALWVINTEDYLDSEQTPLKKVFFKTVRAFAGRIKLKNLKLFAATDSAPLWTQNDVQNSIRTGESFTIVLDAVYQQVAVGHYILLAFDQQLHWAKVKEAGTGTRVAQPRGEIKINQNRFEILESYQRVTALELDAKIDGGVLKNILSSRNKAALVKNLRVHFGLVEAGQIVGDPRIELTPDDPLNFTAPIETPLGNFWPSRFLLEDKNQLNALITGELNLKKNAISPFDPGDWETTFRSPVLAYGNVLSVSRGETVRDEILGDGNAALANQSFILKNNPLTYLPAITGTNNQRVANTLQVYVDGIRWKEVPSFFLAGENDPVYIVRQNEEEESIITFGDGVRGRRLPTGIGNVIAHYRYGAGASSPPVGSISQIAKPMSGLQAVKNPIAAYGGADSEPKAETRTNAPKSALILGRAVSIKDMEAVTLSVPGVRAVQAEWRWEGRQQRPVVHIWYVGGKNLKDIIYPQLRNVSDPSTPLQVDQAKSTSVTLMIDVAVDPRYTKEDIQKAIKDRLMNKKAGLLIPENLGIGQVFYRSRLFETILEVSGTTCVTSVLWNGKPLNEFGTRPLVGRYFDFETTMPAISLNDDLS